MTINPPADKEKKWYRIAFICLGLFGIALAIPQYLEQEKKEAVTSETLGEIETNTTKPTFQLFLNSFVEKQISDQVETNLVKKDSVTYMNIVHKIVKSRTASLEGLAAGEIINLKGSKDISLSITVYGDTPADHFTIEFTTPWVDQCNITGDRTWQDLGNGDFLDPSTKTFSRARSMRLETFKLIPPNKFIPLPKLHIPTNYPTTSLPMRFTIYSNNAKSQEVGVIFKLE